jgi:hypothetical protein
MKSYIDQIFSYHMGIDKNGFTTAVSTSDQGLLIYGYTYRTGEERTYVILKLAADYSIQWIQEFGLQGDNNFAFQIIECSDHNFIIVREKTILKINSEGNTFWSYQSSDNDIMPFDCVTPLGNGQYLAMISDDN